MNTVLILANGVWKDEGQARRLAECADLVIAADGGFTKALAARVRVDLVVGDLDSIDDVARRAISASGVGVQRHPVAKDWSDLELALDQALARRPASIVILGSLGNRIDHALTSVHLLERGLETGIAIELVDGTQSVVLIDARREVADARIGDRVSLVPISDSVRATTSGLRFALRDETLRRAASRGVSNVVDRPPVILDVMSGRLLVIHDRPEAGS